MRSATLRIATSLPGCVLREWRKSDKALLVAHANNRSVWRNLTDAFPHPYTENDADRWLGLAAAPGRSVHLAITLNGDPIGGIGAIAGEGVSQRTAQIGYWLGERHWGRGIATAACHAMVRHLEVRRTFARLEARVFAWNPGSMRVLEKVGFQCEGALRRSVSKDGLLIDSVVYAYLTAD